MSERFDPQAPALIVPVRVVGPREAYTFRCTLDTGSTCTVMPARLMRRLGIDLSRPLGHVRLRTATGITLAPLIRVPALAALDRVRTEFVVAAHDLPLGVETDGLLGLDFLRGFVLTVDFVRGRIDLSRRRWWQFWN